MHIHTPLLLLIIFVGQIPHKCAPLHLAYFSPSVPHSLKSLELAKKVAVINGAGAGLGRRIAEFCFERGCSFFLADASTASVECLITTVSGGVPAVVGQGAVASCKSAFGRIDILVCNTCINLVSPVEKTTSKQLNNFMNIDALGTLLGVRTVAPLIKLQEGGSIVCIKSVGATRGAAMQVACCGSKSAVYLMSKALALELIPSNIGVNMVYPGARDTQCSARWQQA